MYYDLEIYDGKGCVDHNVVVATMEEAHKVTEWRTFKIVGMVADSERYECDDNQIALGNRD